MKNEKTPPIKNRMMMKEKAKDFKGTFKKLIKYISNYKFALIFVIILAIGSTVFAIVSPKILGNATTELYNGMIAKLSNTGSINFNEIGRILLIVLILYIISSIFSYIEGIIMAYVTQKTSYRLRKEIIEKINRLPMKYFDKKTHGEVLSLITNDVDTLSQSLNQSAKEVITSIITVIGILYMMLTINVFMTLISLIMLPFTLGLIGIVFKKSQKHFKNNQKYLAKVNGNVEEMYSGHNIIKAFNAEDNMLNKFEKNNELLYEAGWKSQFLSGLMPPIMMFVGNLGYVLVSMIGGYLAVIGKITVGNIQSFIQYNKQFTQPLSQIAQISNMLQSMMAASERIFEFLEEDEEVYSKTNPIKLEDIKGNVEFKNIKFGYNDKIIINDFSANIKSGKKIAIVGPTGAGKTTIVKLLMRFYDVLDGEILIDGININKFKRKDLRKIFAMVLQDTWLFNGTIMENVRYGNLSSSDLEVKEALKNAYANHFVETLPNSYDMVINEETDNISGGEKQLLTIARALLANPKILILDEATSSVDTRTEELIAKAMDKLMEGRTSFIIAHRLSTIRNADLILVMNNGDIVETGTHEELLKLNGMYANLYNSQFEKI